MKKISTFIFLSFSLTWTIWILIWLLGVKLGEPVSQLGTIVAMWMPGLAYLILKKVKPDQFKLGANFSLAFKKNWKFYLLALWGPTLLNLAGLSLYFLIFQQQFSLDFKMVEQMIEASGASAEGFPLGLLVLSQVVSSITYAPLVNSLFTLGEEIGWRGYLFPALRQHYSNLQSHLLVGLIWSLWHLPINLQGYNFGLTYWGWPWLGILAMFVFCFSIGVFLSFLIEKTGSLWAPALLHGSLNASAGLGLLFQVTSDSTQTLRILGPTPVGFLAGVPFLLIALLILTKERSE